MAIYWRPWALTGGAALVVLGAIIIAVFFDAEPMHTSHLPWLGGLLLAMGAALIGVGMGRWQRPARGPSKTASR